MLNLNNEQNKMRESNAVTGISLSLGYNID